MTSTTESTRTTQGKEAKIRRLRNQAAEHDYRALELDLAALELRGSDEPDAAVKAARCESAARNRRSLAIRCRALADRFERKVTA